MKWLITFCISILISNLSTGQEYRISYDGMPELYEHVELVVEQRNGDDYSLSDKRFKLSTQNGRIDGNILMFDKRTAHRNNGIVDIIATNKSQKTILQLSLPVLQEIKFNLYADSIKPVLNYYLNVEGVFSNGSVYPLDTTFISISSDNGTVNGLEWVKPETINFDNVTFTAVCKYDSTITSSTKVYLKKAKSD